MKKLLASITTLSLWISFPGTATAQRITEIRHQDDSYYHEVLNSQNFADYRYRVPANTLGVFTLKNNSGRSDFDIFLYEGNGRQIAQGINNGTQTELLTTPLLSQDRYIYLRVINRGSQTSRYHLYANYISPINRFGIELAKTALLCNPNQNNSNQNLSRGITVLSSIVQGESLGNLALNLAISELTDNMRKQFGYGCAGDLMVNWGVSMVQGVYRNYF
jgi:hypothetical protein